MSDSILFIGGPDDGVWRDLPLHTLTYQVSRFQPIVGFPPFPSATLVPDVIPCPVVVTTYQRTVLNFGGGARHIMVPEGQTPTQTLNYLLAGYHR